MGGLGKKIGDGYLKLAGIPVVFLGIGLQRAWSSMICDTGRYPLMDNRAYLVGVSVLVIVNFVMALSFRRVSPLYRRTTLLVLAALAASIGSGLIIVDSSILRTGVLTFVGAGLAVGATGVAMLLWCEFFSTMAPTLVALVYSLAIVFGELVNFFCRGMDPGVLWILLVAMPLVNILWAVDSIHRSSGETHGIGTRSGRGGMSFPIKPVVLMAAVSFSDAFIGIVGRGDTPATFIGTVAIPCVIIAAVLSESRHFQLGIVYKIAMPAIIVAMILLMPIGGLNGSAAVALFSGGDTALAIMTMIIFSNISYRYGMDPIWLNGIERGIRFSVFVLGSLLQTLIMPALGGQAMIVVRIVVAAATVILFSFMFIPNSELFSRWGIRSIDDDMGRSDDVASAETEQVRRSLACEELGVEFNLTSREQEILLLLAQGKTSAQVEKELFIADGTMRAHVSHIYTKLDVHSRSELRDLLIVRGACR